MNIQLIDGSFSPLEAKQILSELIAVKIRFHENKIQLADAEEDIKQREVKIKSLQNSLQAVNRLLSTQKQSVSLSSQVVVATN